MEQYSIEVANAEGGMRNIEDILQDAYQSTKALGNVERAGAFQEIFGVEAGAAISEVINQQGGGSLTELLEELRSNAGENAQMARVMADNLGGDLKSLRSAWEEVGISITDTNDGPLRDLVQNITTITRGVGEWIKANPELAGTIAKVAAGMIALATVGGAVTMTFASILSPLLFAKFAMTTLGIKVGGLGTALGWIAKTAIPWVAGALKGLLVAMGPIGWGVMAIAATALVIYKYWEPIKGFFVGLWQQVKAAFAEGVGGVARLLLNWSPYGLLYNAFTSTIERLGITIPDGFRDFGSMIVDGIINGITAKLGELRDSITGMASNAMGWFRDVLDINSPSRVFTEYGGFITEGLANGIEDDADSPVKQVRSLANRMRDAATGLMLSAGISSPAVAIEAQPPVLPSMPELTTSIQRPELPALEALEIRVPDMPRLMSEVATPETPTLDALQVERPTLPTLGALEIHVPDMPHLMSEVATPEAPTLDALQVEQPTLPKLGALEIHAPDMPRLMREVATPETPTLDALQVERPTLPTLEALAFQWPELPQFDPLRIDTSGIQIDARPPLQSHASAAPSGGLVIHGGINIEVHAAPGMDEQALARLVNEQVQRALQDAERRAAAASRRNFHDND